MMLSALLSLTLSSCDNDEESVALSDQCYISSFTLGTVRQQRFATDSEGNDSSYTTTFAGRLFPMTIDHRTLTIENPDSLPVHSHVGAVLATVNASGVMGWRRADLEEGADTTWNTYSESDSIDFRHPLTFLVVAPDAKSSRRYTVKVNVHRQKGDSTEWNSKGIVPYLGAMNQRKAFCRDGMLMVLAVNSAGEVVNVQTPLTGEARWQMIAATGAEQAVPTTLQKTSENLYVSTTDGRVLQSTNGVDWSDAGLPAREGLQLVAASEQRVYALIDGNLWSSAGEAWQEERLDDASAMLPATELQGLYYTLPNGQERLMLIGQSEAEGVRVTRIWAKSWNKGEEASEGWMFYTPNGADKYRLPALANLNVLAYDDAFVALGGASADGAYKPMSEALRSRDHGVTWRPYSAGDMNIDPEIQKAAANAQDITCAVDDNQFVWVLVDNRAWKGRINRLGFLR